MTKILLTGGLGYIGSHVVVELLEKGYEIVIIDDLSNSELYVLDRIQEITGSRLSFSRAIFETVPLNREVSPYYAQFWDRSPKYKSILL